MIKIKFVPPNSSEWNDWCKKAKEKADRHLRDYGFGKAVKVSEALYKRQREVIFSASFGKCAYCEANFKLDQSGDVEHFRPKGAITDENDQPIEIDDGDAGRRPHPGYFWLAYDWTNLLPSCGRCNRPIKLPDGRLVGKWNRFPVAGAYARTPAELAVERPLLLNPISDDPSKHLDMDPDTGIIFALGDSPEGRMCIAIFDLNREGLPEARRDVYDNVMAREGEEFSARRNKSGNRRHSDYLKKHKDGSAEYSMAGRKALGAVRAILEARLQELVGE